MVDPDNRSPVNFDSLIADLKTISEASNSRDLGISLFSKYENGLIKMYVLKNVLDFRERNEDLFNWGKYIPISSFGKYASNIVSYARQYKRSRIIVVVSRFLSRICEVNTLPIGEVWKGTYSKLPVTFCGEYTNILNGHKIRIGEENGFRLELELALSSLPFCLLSG